MRSYNIANVLGVFDNEMVLFLVATQPSSLGEGGEQVLANAFDVLHSDC